MQKFNQYLAPVLKQWYIDKKEEGFIPTIELLIEELEHDL